jgi:hypothetical protein
VDGNLGQAPAVIIDGHLRYSPKVLEQAPVDVLVVEQGHLKHPTRKYQRENWEELVAQTPSKQRPKVVIEAWPASAQSWLKGPVCKATLTRWKDQGFDSHCKLMRATHYGGAIDQCRLIVVRIQEAASLHWIWPEPEARWDTP